MFAVRIAFVGLFVALALPTVALAAPGAAPGLHAVDEAGGGHVLYGSLTSVTSGPSAFKAGTGLIHNYFDAAPKLLNAIQSADGKILMSAFSAVLKQKPVSGLMISTYNPAGGSSFGVLFDGPAGLAKTLPGMLRHFDALTKDSIERTRPPAAEPTGDFARYKAAASHLALPRTPFPDGTATIGVAPGFTPQLMKGGQFIATAEDGAYARLYNPIPMQDPNGTLYKQMQQIGGGAPLPAGMMVVAYDSNPVNAWKQFASETARQHNVADPDPQVKDSAPLNGVPQGWTGRMMSGTMTLRGEPFIFTGAVLSTPPPGADGGWMLQVTVLAAPAAHAADDMPALIAMRTSEQMDEKAIRDQTMRNIAMINEQCSQWLAANGAAGDAARNERFEQSMANAASAQDVIDNSAANFIHYINDTAVVQQGSTGSQLTVNANLAAALAQSDPKNFTLVPIGQYQNGMNR